VSARIAGARRSLSPLTPFQLEADHAAAETAKNINTLFGEAGVLPPAALKMSPDQAAALLGRRTRPGPTPG
jgi:hypothetical protein